MISQVKQLSIDSNFVIISKAIGQIDFSQLALTLQQRDYVCRKLEKSDFVEINLYDHYAFFVIVNVEKSPYEELEKLRKYGSNIAELLASDKQTVLYIKNYTSEDYSLALAEGIALSNYRFDKYLPSKKSVFPTDIFVVSEIDILHKLQRVVSLINGVTFARNVVNEPLSYMTAKKLAETVEQEGEKSGFNVEVLDKKKIESLKMGGLLAVNRGSSEPPTFSILKYEPVNAINAKPYVLVGKGIVFDTGGYNLKTTSFISTMKSDKSGAAAVAGTISALAQANIPIKVYGLIPATDNRIGANAYVPDDIITMYDGTTVEIVNTDAEGRLILADALSYAQKYEPELVIDIATLTGSAVVAVGEKNTAIIGNSQTEIDKMIECGFRVWERQIQLPLWDDFADDLKSQVAQMKNTGKRSAGTIVAAAFLKHFTNYPWAHLDIAGPAYAEKKDSYRGYGASAVPVRMLFDYFCRKVEEK